MKPLDFADPLADPNTCQHARLALTQATIAGGAVQMRRQCLDCAQSVGNAVRHDVARQEARGAPIPPFDNAQRRKGLTDYKRRLFEDKEKERQRHKADYDEYMQSDAWRVLRQRVLLRCKGMCEGCGIHPATQVHHLTYANLFAEFLFELVGICEDCHLRFHGEEGDYEEYAEDESEEAAQ